MAAGIREVTATRRRFVSATPETWLITPSNQQSCPRQVSGTSDASKTQLGLIGTWDRLSSHNYVNLNIGLKLTAEHAAAYFFEWLAEGIVIGMSYRPAR